jgi:hypothetical protein
MDLIPENLEAEIKEVKELLMDIETPATRELIAKNAIDTIRKGLTQRFRILLAARDAFTKKVDKDTAINKQSQWISTLDRPQLITTFYKENPSSSPAQEAQESLS